MKRKRLLLLCGVLAVLLSGIYITVNAFFPKANPIRYPEPEEIISAYTSVNTPDASIPLSEKEYGDLIELIRTAKPTRRQSLNDTPSAFGYYTIEITTAERDYRYFVYEKDADIYIEVPYEGIYSSDIQILNYILKYHQEGAL